MFRLGGMEWVIILVIVILLFGPGRIGAISGEIGKSIKAFRDGMRGDDDSDKNKKDANSNTEPK